MILQILAKHVCDLKGLAIVISKFLVLRTFGMCLSINNNDDFILFKCMTAILNCNSALKSLYGLKLVKDLFITLKVQFIGLRRCVFRSSKDNDAKDGIPEAM